LEAQQSWQCDKRSNYVETKNTSNQRKETDMISKRGLPTYPRSIVHFILAMTVLFSANSQADCYKNLEILESNIQVVSGLWSMPGNMEDAKQLKQVMRTAYSHYQQGNDYQCEQTLGVAFDYLSNYYPAYFK
jgi:hypothetical protein